MSQNNTQNISIKEEATLSQLMCRICATEQNDYESMNNLLSSIHNGLYFVDVLQECLQQSIDRDNGFPLNICLDCTSNLIVVHNFRLTYEASEKKLTKMLGLDHLVSDGFERKVDVVSDQPESDLKPNYFIDCATFEATATNCDGYNDRKICETSLRVEPQTKPKLDKLKVQRYECYLCKATYNRITFLRKHMTSDHIISNKIWSCSDCHKRYSQRKRLMEHFYKHISTQCDHCSESFTTLRDMRKHHKEVHTDLLTSHQCDRCPKKFVLNAQLRIHMHDHLHLDKQLSNNRHDSTNVRPARQLNRKIPKSEATFLCSECGKTFKNKWLLSSHQNVHNSEKLFVCSKCPSRFRWKVALTYHMTIHQDQVEDRRKHVCETCGTSFTSRSAMKSHEKIHSGLRPYECDKCSKKFSRRSHLTRHYLSHTGEKPYICKYCDKCFRQFAQLNTHLRLHVGKNTYQCALCPDKFKLKSEMKQHEYEHYEKKDFGS